MPSPDKAGKAGNDGKGAINPGKVLVDLGRGPAEHRTAEAVGAQAVRAQAVGRQTVGAGSFGALAIGAFAIGALAIGALAIGRLADRPRSPPGKRTSTGSGSTRWRSASSSGWPTATGAAADDGRAGRCESPDRGATTAPLPLAGEIASLRL